MLSWPFYFKHGFKENTGLLTQFLVYGGVLYGMIRMRKREIILLTYPLLLFLLMGSGDFSLKVFHESFPKTYIMDFILLVFIIATLYTLILVLVQRVRIRRELIINGILLGIPNFLSAYFILKVLQNFPGAIAFPLNNIGIIVLSVVVGRLVWKERLEKQTAAAIVIAAAAVVLLNF